MSSLVKHLSMNTSGTKVVQCILFIATTELCGLWKKLGLFHDSEYWYDFVKTEPGKFEKVKFNCP